MTPEELRAAFIKSRGLNLTSTPVPPVAIPPPTPVQTQPIIPTAQSSTLPPPASTVIVPSPGGGPTDPNAEPVRINPHGAPAIAPPVVQPPPVQPVAAAPPARVPSAFPVGGTAPIVATNPVIEQGPGGGVSLNTNPVAPGWAGTVGLPASKAESEGFMKGQKYNDLIAGLEGISKGLNPKKSGDTGANTITPMSVQPNQPSNLSAELMGQILQGRRRKYGISLAG